MIGEDDTSAPEWAWLEYPAAVCRALLVIPSTARAGSQVLRRVLDSEAVTAAPWARSVSGAAESRTSISPSCSRQDRFGKSSASGRPSLVTSSRT